MKKIILIGMLWLPVLTNGQLAAFENRRDLILSIDSLLAGYISNIPGSADKNAERVFGDFKKLFTDSARIPDDITPVYFDGVTQTPFKVQQRGVEEYLQRIRKHYPKGVRTSVLNHTLDLSGIQQRKIVLYVHRIIYGTTTDGFAVRNEDSLAVHIVVDAKLSHPKINDVKYLGGDFRITNDRDKDFVLDKIDKCPDLPGMKEFEGCPPPSNPQQFLTLSIVKSLSANVSVEAPGFSESGYPSLIQATKNISAPESDPATESQFGLSLTFSNFFGTNRTFGAGIGLQYNYYSFDLRQENLFVEYASIDNAGYIYRRVIESNRATTESEKLHLLSIPLTAIYSIKISEKLNVSLSAGPHLTFMLSGSSKPSASFDYGAIYDKEGNNSTNQFNGQAAIGGSWWVMTEESAASHGASQAAIDNYFKDRFEEGYDIMNNREIDESVTIKTGIALGLTAEAGLLYKISSSNYLTFGCRYWSAPLKGKSEGDYKVTDRVGEYNSLVNGVDKLKINYIAVHIGLAVAIK